MASQANGHANGQPSSYSARHNLAPHFIGGNHVSKAVPSKLKDFVVAHDGHTVIGSVSLRQQLNCTDGRLEATYILLAQ
jgi:acetyl-CoA carboxylase/biotin carboxylase 1